MLLSEDIPELLGKTILLRDGKWVILSARVMKWAGLIATVQKGGLEKKVAVHNAWWDEEHQTYKIEPKREK